MGCCICIDTGSVGLKERFGEFQEEVGPGFHCLTPCVEQVRIVSLKLQDLDVRCETKTKDDVFVNVQVCVQYRVLNAQDSAYKMADPHGQIRAYVFDVIRSEVPKLDLNDVFLEKDKLSAAVLHELGESLKQYGFEIVNTPVTDIDPDSKVKKSLNAITTEKNNKLAMTSKAESDAIVKIKLAEAEAEEIIIKSKAEAESKYQSGLGLSRQRQAIVDGLSASVLAFQEGVKDIDAKTVMDLIMLTQYFDMMKDIGTAPNRGTTIFVPSGPASVGDLTTQLRQAFHETTDALNPSAPPPKGIYDTRG